MEVDPVAKQRKISSESNVRVIGTHSGCFHCDEVLAVVMLKFLPEWKNAQIVRTRDEEILKTCDIVVDVGGVFNPETKRFDHHQKTFTHSMSTVRPGTPWVTKLSSAGLVYAHFGEDIIAHILDKGREDEVVVKLFDKVYTNFIEEIDAIDNGVAVSDGELKYRITTTLSGRVGGLNSSWRDPDPSEEKDMVNFHKAMELVRSEFLTKVHFYANDWWEAYSIVAAAVEARFEVDSSGLIVEFPQGGVPWKDHLKDIEDTTGVMIAFVIYQDGSGMWRIQAVPVAPASFTSRVPLHPAWCGLRNKELEEISKIPTIKFVHSSGFIGGASDRGDAIQMAKLSLAAKGEWNGD
ncbi:MYG1 exonuclease isoform X2 [Folsomia candida]|nr:MYG1 exonuclease isoform X2 [Folsomia candida]